MATQLEVPKMGASIDFARGLFQRGTECFGLDEITKVFGASLAPAIDQVPRIPFTEEELKRARELGQFLVLCGPVSMAEMNKVFDNKLGDGKLLYDTVWYRGEDFYLQEKTSWHWRLTTREVIPGSTSQNYLQQTKTIATYLTDQVYAEQELPSIYAEAIAELDRREAELKKLMDTDWQKATEELAGLAFNHLCRETPAQVLQSVALSKCINHEYPLSGRWTWTNQRSTGGFLVCVGNAASDGVRVGHGYPEISFGYIGVRFSRRALDLGS